MRSYRKRVMASLIAAFSLMITCTAGAYFYLTVNLLEGEVDRAAFPVLVASVSVLVVMAIILAFVLTRHLASPIIELAEAAGRLSRGDLDRPIPVVSQDELGELALSLERMRASLRAAMARLNRYRSG